MLRNLLVVVALLVPAAARAEFRAKKAVEARPTTAMKLVDTKHAEEPLTIDGMLAKINTAYMFGMQRCYVKGLRQDPTLAGKVTMVLTVNPDGRVTGSATGIAPAVDGCLTNRLSMWRFPSPRDNKDKPTRQSFQISLLLRQ